MRGVSRKYLLRNRNSNRGTASPLIFESAFDSSNELFRLAVAYFVKQRHAVGLRP
jgi:hypothetical protein